MAEQRWEEQQDDKNKMGGGRGRMGLGGGQTAEVVNRQAYLISLLREIITFFTCFNAARSMLILFLRQDHNFHTHICGDVSMLNSAFSELLLAYQFLLQLETVSVFKVHSSKVRNKLQMAKNIYLYRYV